MAKTFAETRYRPYRRIREMAAIKNRARRRIRMKSKRVSSLVFISVVLIAIISLTFAFGITAGISGRMRSANAAWEGEGSGTSADPYLIGTKAELEKFRDIVNGINEETRKTYICGKLTADIDLEGDDDHQWTPIGTSSYCYGGDFDGNGHTISGLYINDSTIVNAGLFGNVGRVSVGGSSYVYGAIKNLTVVGSITCKKGAGIVYKTGSLQCIIEGCTNKVNVSADTENGNAGGIVGENYANITDCVNYGNLRGSVVGGIFSYNTSESADLSVKNCINYGTVTAPMVGGICAKNGSVVTGCVNNGAVVCNGTIINSNAGGISGDNSTFNNHALITDCVNNGTVTVIDETSDYCDNIGGIVGYMASANATIAYCVNHGNVSYQSGTYQTTHIGGIIGMTNHNSVLIKSCFNDGAITGYDYVGGIASYNYGPIENCYNVGNVTGHDYVGGIVGSHNNNSIVKNCYSIGAVAAEGSRKGMKWGFAYNSNAFEDCYYLSDGTGTGALSAAQFAEESSFNNWSFGDVWAMYQETNGFMRPYLVRTYVKYYDKAGDATSYAQARTLLGVEGALRVTLYNNTTSFGADYDTLFAVGSGVTQDGWATEFKGKKAYSFETAYTGTETLSLYPHYAIDAPTSATGTGYEATYDSASHNISVSIEHDLGVNAIYSYQWYKAQIINSITYYYYPIYGATGSTFSVNNEADSSKYKVTYKVKCDGHDEYRAYEGEVKNIVVSITGENDPVTIYDKKVAYIGQTLASIDLDDGWAWSDPSQSLDEVGTFWFAATYDSNVYYIAVQVRHANNGAWTGSGSGTQDDPYIITNKAEMELFRDIVNGQNGSNKNQNACAKLAADIDLEGDFDHQWIQIGNSAYYGEFDGNGHTISGLYINDIDKYVSALFGYIGENGTNVGIIKDLTVDGLNTAYRASGIVYEVTSSNNIVENCVNKVTVTAKANYSSDHTASGIAHTNKGMIKNCVNEGGLYGTYVGGIAAYNYAGDSSNSSIGIIDCVNNGPLIGIDNGHPNYLGGIVSVKNCGYIIGCENNGVVRALYSSTTYNFYAGGISGQNMGTIAYCVNNADITVGATSSASYVGGITATQNYDSDPGDVNKLIAYCVNNGDVTFSIKYDSNAIYTAGGIVGSVQNDYHFEIKNCYNVGQVDGYKYSGGIIGYVYPAVVTANNLIVENCYNIGGQVGTDTGEIIGGDGACATITNCHYLASTTDAATGALAKADFADVNNFSGWSFGDVWAMYQEMDGFVRPYLVKTCVKYYDKAGDATSYAQAKTLLGIENALDVTLYNKTTSFGADYDTLFAFGYIATQNGWATEYKGEKVYDFGDAYTDTKTLELYPAYVLAADPAVAEISEDYNNEYDGNTHVLVIIVMHGDDEVAYQWCKKNVVTNEYESIVGATNNTYGVKYVADSGMYRVLYSVIIDGYEFVYESAEISVTISKATPDYTAPTGLAATYGETLSAVALTDGWAWDDATLSVGNVGEHQFSATYTPEDTDNYNTVTIDLTVTVNKAAAVVPTGLNATYGQTLSDVELPDGWAWADATQNVGELGEHVFSANYAGSDNYNAASDVDVTVTVGKATPSYEAPTGLVATIGQTLSDVELSEGWAWVDDQQELNKVGPYSYAATYTPEDTTHYSVVEIDLEVGVYHGDWTGSGDGKSNSPYVITDKAQLEHFRDIVNGYYLKPGQSQNSGAYAVLAASIVLGGESEPWTPIGTTSFSGSYYRGVFDGAGFTISGLYVSGGSEDDYVGFFGVVSGTVKNLTVSGTVIGKKGVGGIAGRVEGGRAIGCTNEADVTCSEIAWYRYAGGIVGYVQSGTITDCVNKGNVIGYEAGGIAGHIVGGRVENCVNEASASVAASDEGGGIIGELEHAGAYRFYELSYCINKGTVGNVDGADAYLGGIVGYAGCGPIRYCYNEGAITNTQTGFWTAAGGIVGRFSDRECCVIENCYNTATITGGDYVGGIIGMKAGSNIATVRNCYNLGEMTASNDQNTKGEILGYIYNGEITNENCYYLAGESKKGCGNLDDAEGVIESLTAAEFADASNFSGWSFGKVWAMYTVGGETRPYLVKTCVKYYDKTKAATSYAQPRTLLGIDGTLDAVLLYGSDGFVGDYAELYAKDGYAQDGWATTSTGAVAYEFGAEYASNESISLYPHYSVVTYTILYVNALNGASGIVNVNPTTYTIEDEDIVLVAPTRIGYDLTGWTGEGVTIAAGSFGDQVFEAIWTLHAYTITYTDAENGVNGVTNANPTTYTINDSTIVLSVPSRTDYDFVRWTGDGTTIYAGSTGDRTFVAHWAPHSYTITYVNATDGVGGVTNTNPTTYTVEDEEFELVAPTRVGYELATWSGEGVTLPTGSSGDRIFEATWTVETYTITYEGEEGAEHANPVTYTVEELPIVLTDLVREHYDFIGWANGDADPETGYTIAEGTAGNLTLTATWAPHAYTITYVNAENGVGGVTNANPATYTIEDEAIELVAPTRVGYDLTAWTGEGVTIPAGSYGDKTYEATWTPIVYTITYEIPIEDVVNPNPTTYTIEDLPLVLVKPTNEYYDFIFWYVNDDYEREYAIPAGTTGNLTLGTQWNIKGDIGGGHVFVLEAPAVESLNGYIGTYDGKTHEISATFAEHELDVTYSYRWKKDGVIIQGATGATLTVKDVADSGVYTLLYTVSYDEYTSVEKETAAIVVVIGKKNVTLNLPAVTSVEGNVGNATATVSGAVQGDRIGIIIVYFQGETELAEKPTRAGKYTAVASINEANYDADEAKAAFVINVATIDPENIEKPDGEDITVSSDDGFDEGTELVITKPDSPEDIAEIQEKIGDDKEIVEIYHFEMEEDGEKAELEDPVTIRLPIPEELKDEKFELINIDGDDTGSVKYKIDGDYVEFETSTMGDFVFVKDAEKTETEEGDGTLRGSMSGKISVELLLFILLGVMVINFVLSIVSVIKLIRRG